MEGLLLYSVLLEACIGVDLESAVALIGDLYCSSMDGVHWKGDVDFSSVKVELRSMGFAYGDVAFIWKHVIAPRVV